ncbi:hypothetical protein D3C85_1770770 [compost metagenome]
MNTIDRSYSPTQRSATSATKQASAVAPTASRVSWPVLRVGIDRPVRRARARACGVPMMVIS